MPTTTSPLPRHSRLRVAASFNLRSEPLSNATSLTIGERVGWSRGGVSFIAQITFCSIRYHPIGTPLVSRREMSDGEQPSSDALRPDQAARINARSPDVPIIQCRMNAPQLSRTTRRGLESSAVAGSVGSASRLSIARMAFAAMSRRG